MGFYIYYISYLSSKTKYIGKISFSNFEKSIGSFIWAIVFATIVHNYILQPFVIPTGSLEKTLRVGDFLFVSKFHYGARVPQTAVSFPMVHDTIVGTGIRSYLNKPQIPYFRLPGFQKINVVRYKIKPDIGSQMTLRKGVKKPMIKNQIMLKDVLPFPLIL